MVTCVLHDPRFILSSRRMKESSFSNGPLAFNSMSIVFLSMSDRQSSLRGVLEVLRMMVARTSVLIVSKKLHHDDIEKRTRSAQWVLTRRKQKSFTTKITMRTKCFKNGPLVPGDMSSQRTHHSQIVRQILPMPENINAVSALCTFLSAETKSACLLLQHARAFKAFP